MHRNGDAVQKVQRLDSLRRPALLLTAFPHCHDRHNQIDPDTTICDCGHRPFSRDVLPRWAQTLAPVRSVDLQPLAAEVERVTQAMFLTGSPLAKEQQAGLQAAAQLKDPAAAVDRIQQILDPLCLVEVDINPESRVKVQAGPAPKKLIEQGWRMFLVKIHNQAGVTAALHCTSPNAAALHDSNNSPEPPQKITASDIVQRWLDIDMYQQQPLAERLSGLELEYGIIELFSRDRGQREAKLSFDVGQGTQDLEFRNEVNLLFDCEPCAHLKLQILDDDGTPTTGQFTFRDTRGRVYPARARRLAPDFFFHDQIYRHDGEELLLPAGEYHVTYTRGPEYRLLERDIEVPEAPFDKQHTESFRMRRWINLCNSVGFPAITTCTPPAVLTTLHPHRVFDRPT